MKVLKITGTSIEEIGIDSTNIRTELKGLQAVLGGDIETIPLCEDTLFLVDQDGIAKGLPQNMAATSILGRWIVGTALIVGIVRNADGEWQFGDYPERFRKLLG